MAKFLCVCGEQISTSGNIPNENEWLCMSAMDRVFDRDAVSGSELYMQMVIFYRCPVSDHLWFFWSGMDGEPSLYELRGVG